MEERKKADDQATPAITGPSTGPEGVDKTPGEETSDGILEFTQETQKGKKVDADPEQESDQPVDQSSIPATNK